MIVILFGVSGTGKTTLGKMLAHELSLSFYDADDFHPKENIKKMASGSPLTDEDRLPWLQALAGLLHIWEMQGGAVLACSALKESYRMRLSREVENISWVYLNGSPDLIKSRLEQRKGHFFKPELLTSQLEDLEIPKSGIEVDIDQSPEKIISELLITLK